jgi:hypothetical protein
MSAATVGLTAYELVEHQRGSGHMVYWEKEMEPDSDGAWYKRADVEAMAAHATATPRPAFPAVGREPSVREALECAAGVLQAFAGQSETARLCITMAEEALAVPEAADAPHATALTDEKINSILAVWNRTSNSRVELCRMIETAVLAPDAAPDAPPTPERERRLFEAACLFLLSWQPKDMARDGDQYAGREQQRAWRVWQARADLANKPGVA